MEAAGFKDEGSVYGAVIGPHPKSQLILKVVRQVPQTLQVQDSNRVRV